jgi:hypothetical protein
MTAVTFSARGHRWCVLPITNEVLTKEQIPALPGTGLVFTSENAEMRFLPLAPDAVPSVESLQRKPVADLSAWVQIARPLPR